MMAAELRLIPYSDAFALVIKNNGPSVARNVRVRFDPPIPDPPDASTSATPFLKRRYAGLIPALTPGMELENVYASYVSGHNQEPTPERVEVRITYEGPDGHSYEGVFPLAVDLLTAHTYVVSSASPESIAKQALQVLKDIRKEINGLRSG